MKHNVILVGILGVILGFTACKKESATDLYTEEEQAAIAEAVVDPANAPILTLKESNFDFGDVKMNEKKEHYFVISNDGKSPLIIKDASATCGCTVPEIPSKPIPVGGQDSIKVEFTAGSVAGKTQKTVTMNTNTATGQETFTISANVVE